jgi:hypothetical protein
MLFAAIAAAIVGLNVGAGSTEITDAESAIRAAKNYTKGRCTAETPCTYKPEHEGKQWRVWVQLTRRNSPREAARPYPGGTLILYFDERGNLLRRLEGD